jgi:general secretion pathway protein I
MRGFTLLEVVVALIIAGIAGVALFQAVGTGLHETLAALMYDQAIVRAKSRLEAATHGTQLAAGDWRGDDGGSFRWRLHVAPIATAIVSTTGVYSPSASRSRAVVLYAVTVWVGWNDGGRERQVRLDTERVGG